MPTEGMTDSEILPNFRLVRLDQTSSWSSVVTDVLKGGKIHSLYLYDKNQITHCCEITPSYCLYWIRDEAEMGDGSTVDEAVENDIARLSADTEPVEYIHCRILDKFPEDRFHDVAFNEAYDPTKHDGKESWYKEELELALDYVRCNS